MNITQAVMDMGNGVTVEDLGNGRTKLSHKLDMTMFLDDRHASVHVFGVSSADCRGTDLLPFFEAGALTVRAADGTMFTLFLHVANEKAQ